ncbi:hypothetical protein N2152v2_002465 [Parachlorella kessleri]
MAATPALVDSFSVGVHVKLSTTLGEPGSTPFHHNLRMLKTTYVKAVLSAVPPSSPPTTQLPFVDMQRCRDREEKAIRAAEAEAHKIGVGVTREAQQIFDALCKTMPCRWEGQSIVVLEEVDIPPPYGPEHCRSRHADDRAAMDRVRKVLIAERQRLGYS